MKETWDAEERAKRAKKCGNPKGFTMKQFCKNVKTRSKPGQKPNRLKETEMDTRPPAQQDYEDLLTTYSDVYKETYGYRPRFDMAMKFTSAQAVSDAIQDLYDQQKLQDTSHEPYHTEEFDTSPEEFKPLPKMSGMKNRMALESFIRETLLSK